MLIMGKSFPNFYNFVIHCWVSFFYIMCLTFHVKGQTLSSTNISINYNQITNEAELAWTKTFTSTLVIDYSLQNSYSYTQEGVTESFNNNYQLSLAILSTVVTHTIQLTPHSFSRNSGVSTEIMVTLQAIRLGGTPLSEGAVIGYRNTGIQVQQVPEYACPGDRVDILCDLTLQTDVGNRFDQGSSLFVVGDSTTIVFGFQLGTNMISGGINLQRLSETPISLNNTRYLTNISLLTFTSSDAGFLLGAVRGYSGNDGPFRSFAGLNIQSLVAPNAVGSLETSVDLFNSTTCESMIYLSWTDSQHSNATASSYLIYLNGTEIDRTNASVNSFVDVRTLQLDTQYNYSVSAANCNGTSPQLSTDTLCITSYNIASSNVSILYNQSSDTVDLHWNLTQNSLQILIQYSLEIDYIYSRNNIKEQFQTSATLNLLSTDSNYSLQLTRHGLSVVDGMSTEISVRLRPIRQCGQVIPDLTVYGFFRVTIPGSETVASINVTLPGSETALPINVAAAIVLGVIGFFILAFVILTIIFVAVGIIIWHKMLTEKDSKQINGKEEKGLELNQKDGNAETKSPNDSTTNTVFANLEN